MLHKLEMVSARECLENLLPGSGIGIQQMRRQVSIWKKIYDERDKLRDGLRHLFEMQGSGLYGPTLGEVMELLDDSSHPTKRTKEEGEELLVKLKELNQRIFITARKAS